MERINSKRGWSAYGTDLDRSKDTLWCFVFNICASWAFKKEDNEDYTYEYFYGSINRAWKSCLTMVLRIINDTIFPREKVNKRTEKEIMGETKWKIRIVLIIPIIWSMKINRPLRNVRIRRLVNTMEREDVSRRLIGIRLVILRKG